MLILPIKKKWFDMIRSGEKKDEYRGRKEYWRKRFASVLGLEGKELDKYILYYGNTEPFEVMYRNGYSSNSPSFIAKVSLSIGIGREEWGAVSGEEYYVLKNLEIMEGV